MSDLYRYFLIDVYNENTFQSALSNFSSPLDSLKLAATFKEFSMFNTILCNFSLEEEGEAFLKTS